MTPKAKRRLHIIALSIGALLALLALLAIYIYAIGRDIPPADFSDLALPAEEPISPEDNAYTYFRKAADALIDSYTDENGESVSLGQYLRKNRTHSVIIAKVLSDNHEALEYLQQGIQCQHCVFPVPMLTNFQGSCSLLDDVQVVLNMHYLMLYKIKHEHTSEKFDTAVHDVHALLRCGQLIRQNPNSLIVSLVGMSLGNDALLEAQRLVRNSKLSEYHLIQLLEYVDDTRSNDDSVRDTIKAEFQINIMGLKDKTTLIDQCCLFGSSDSFFMGRHNFHPHRTQRDLANRYRSLISDIPKFYSDVTFRYNEPKELSLPSIFFVKNAIGKYLVSLHEEVMMEVVERHLKTEGTIAATKIIIACHLFQRETGRAPQTLDELVPAYLPSVPLDPFDGKPFRYNPDLGVVYSVGKSLEDLGGITGSSQPIPPDDFSLIWRKKNAVFKIWE